MAKTETISAMMVLRLVRLAEKNNLPVEPLLSNAGLSLSRLSSSSARVPYGAADALLESVARELGPSGLGLALALTRIDESYGAAGLLLVTGSTFRQGLARSLAFQRIWGDGERFSLLPYGEGCAVRFRHPGESRLARAVTAECALVEVLEGVRALVDQDAIPDSVAFTHAALGDVQALADHFGLEAKFEQPENRITLSSSLVDRPMRAFRDFLTVALEREAARALSLLPSGDSLAERARPLLSGEEGLRRSLAEVAGALRVSSRTLQRRLRQEGTSFERLIDEARQTYAITLQQLGTPVKEIAFRLGFHDPSALARARRRWSQTTFIPRRADRRLDD